MDGKSKPEAKSTLYFPVFVNLSGRRVTIVGGGSTAAKRIKTLVKFGVSVRIIAPELSPEAARLVRGGKAKWLRLEFAPQLLAGSDLVIAATNRREVNHAVAEAAKEMRILVSIEDSREESSYLFPTVVRSESLVAGIVADEKDYIAVKWLVQRLRDKLFSRY